MPLSSEDQLDQSCSEDSESQLDAKEGEYDPTALVDPVTGAIDFSKSKAYNEDLCRYNLHRTRRAREVC